jgi:hypothetical protein
MCAESLFGIKILFVAPMRHCRKPRAKLKLYGIERVRKEIPACLGIGKMLAKSQQLL